MGTLQTLDWIIIAAYFCLLGSVAWWVVKSLFILVLIFPAIIFAYLYDHLRCNEYKLISQ